MALKGGSELISIEDYLVIDPTKARVKIDRRQEVGGFTKEIYQDLTEVIAFPEIEAQLRICDVYSEIALSE